MPIAKGLLKGLLRGTKKAKPKPKVKPKVKGRGDSSKPYKMIVRGYYNVDGHVMKKKGGYFVKPTEKEVATVLAKLRKGDVTYRKPGKGGKVKKVKLPPKISDAKPQVKGTKVPGFFLYGGELMKKKGVRLVKPTVKDIGEYNKKAGLASGPRKSEKSRAEMLKKDTAAVMRRASKVKAKEAAAKKARLAEDKKRMGTRAQALKASEGLKKKPKTILKKNVAKRAERAELKEQRGKAKKARPTPLGKAERAQSPERRKAMKAAVKANPRAQLLQALRGLSGKKFGRAEKIYKIRGKKKAEAALAEKKTKKKVSKKKVSKKKAVAKKKVAKKVAAIRKEMKKPAESLTPNQKRRLELKKKYSKKKK